jgi:hypothetical protein
MINLGFFFVWKLKYEAFGMVRYRDTEELNTWSCYLTVHFRAMGWGISIKKKQ